MKSLFRTVFVATLFFVSITTAYAGSVSYRINHGTGATQYYSLDNSICATITNTHATNDYFIPASLNTDFTSFLTHPPAGVSISTCAVSCAASGACGVTVSGGTCSSNNTSSVAFGNTCPANFTSTCFNGTWSPTPGANASCTVNPAVPCAATGGCPLTASGGSCTSYSSASVQDAACPVGTTSTCFNGTWSPTPGASASCTAYGWSTGAYGACTGACGTGSQTRTVVCKTSNGTGTTVADTFCNAASKPTVSQSCSTNICCGVGACGNTASGGSCTSYSTNAPVGAVCSAAISTCSGASWNVTPGPFNSCVSGCAASGVCVASSNGDTCSSNTKATVNYPATCPANFTSTCSGGTAAALGSWSPSAGSSSVCSVNHSYSWGAWGACSGGIISRTCSDNGNPVSSSLCEANIGGVGSMSCAGIYGCAAATGSCASHVGVVAATGPVPAGKAFASCSGTVQGICANITYSTPGSAAGCSTSVDSFQTYTNPYSYSACMGGQQPIQCANGTVKSTAVMNCYGGYSWATGSWGSCSAGCSQTRSVTCVNQSDGSPAVDSACTMAKPVTSQSCTGGSCPSAQFVDGNTVRGTANLTCTGQTSPPSSVSLPTGKTFVACEPADPYGIIGGALNSSYNPATGVCSMSFFCNGGNASMACPSSWWCNQYVITARIRYN